jgi:D-aminopeptidase
MAPEPAPRPRLRDLGIVLGRLPPGPLNSITDVPGVRIGQMTRCQGEGPLVPGQGPVRTGVTPILPHAGHSTLAQEGESGCADELR